MKLRKLTRDPGCTPTHGWAWVNRNVEPDFKLIIKEGDQSHVLPVHKIVLVAHSNLYRQLFESMPLDDSYEVDEGLLVNLRFPVKSHQKMIKYIYFNDYHSYAFFTKKTRAPSTKVPLTLEEYGDLFLLAEYYDMTTFKNQLKRDLCSDIHSFYGKRTNIQERFSYLVEIFNLSQSFRLEIENQLVDSLLDIITNHLDEISESSTYEQLDANFLKYLLSQKKLTYQPPEPPKPTFGSKTKLSPWGRM